MSRRTISRSKWSLLLLVVSIACDDGAKQAPDGHPQGSDHEFVSAEGRAGDALRGESEDAANEAADDDASDSDKASSAVRTVEEGDIYRSLGPGRLLNLNPYRGLQVIDISDVSKPAIIGRLRERGHPVELYLVGQRAIVLLNDWSSYYGARTDVLVERESGGLILSVDLSNPAAPTVTDREFIRGSIQTSRLTRQGERAALYVAATGYECSTDPATGLARACPGTIVKSFDASTPDLVPRTALDLGGSVTALQATPEALIVARTVYEPSESGAGAAPRASFPKTFVNLVDISNIDGNMVEGAQSEVAGSVYNKYNLDLRGGVLRVVSGAARGRGELTNHLQTFDAADRTTLRPLHRCDFGEGMQLFATLFMEDRAFFVTYFRRDPFHAFALGADGSCSERSEFVVSGWNDFFRPAFAQRRLVGVGVNDEEVDGKRANRVAVSLYDITNLDNPTPLIARAEVAHEQSHSEARWDDKAFSVIEGAVALPAAADPAVVETGLVLIPFTSYGETSTSYQAGVQLFTFSETTLTRRGVMDHGQPVRRTFQPAPALSANIGDQDLSLFDTTDPNAPVERGRVELAPSYSDVLDYGSFMVRIRDTRELYGDWRGRPGSTPPPAHAEIVAKSSDPDEAAPMAKVAIPAGSRAFRVGSLLVAVSTIGRFADVELEDERVQYDSTIMVFDLQNPAAPAQLSTLTSDRLLPASGYGWGYSGGECGVFEGNYYDDYARVLPNALVFGRNVQESDSLGRYEQCFKSVRQRPACGRDSAMDCEWYSGSESCSRKIGSDQQVCEGSIRHCKRVASMTTCTDVDAATAGATTHCSIEERRRYWQSLELDVLDLRNPIAPTLTPLEFGREEEALGLIADGDSVYFAFKRPHVVAGDPRPFAKHYVRRVALGDPTQPAIGAPVNLPGELLGVRGDRLFTRDLRYGTTLTETWVHTLRQTGEVAEILASRAFAGREVTGVLLDGAERVLVTHRAVPDKGDFYEEDSGDDDLAPSTPENRELDKLTLLQAEGLVQVGETDVDAWSSMTQVIAGKILFSVQGGLLVVNALDPARPYAQAYFPYNGYQRRVTFDGQNIFVAAGPYGIHFLDATTHNLLPRL